MSVDRWMRYAPDRKGPVLVIVLAVALAVVQSAWAQTSPAAKRADDYRTTTVKIWPQRIEKPVLQYALTPRFSDTRKGNAAVTYNAAVAAINKPLSSDDYELLGKLRSLPLAELNEAQAEALLQDRRIALQILRDAAKMEHADWETSIRERGYRILLTNMSGLRNLANLLTLDIRLDIKHARWKEAGEKLQAGYSMARHLGESDTLIESLVGIAIASAMNKCVEDWVCVPGSPNLYWPVNSLPYPFNDLRHPLSVEMDMPLLVFDQLKEWENGRFASDGVSRFVVQMNEVAELGMLPVSGVPLKLRQPAAAAWGMMEYPRAKDFLAARGMSREQIDEMPVPEVLGRYFVRSYEEERDDLFKWMYLPFPAAVKAFEQAENEFQNRAHANSISLLTRILLPSLSHARVTAVRVDVHVAALSIIENLRAYAGEKHALPDALDQLPLYVPVNPMTGKAFVYQRDGDVATLIAPYYKEERKKDGHKYVIRLQRADVVEGPVK